MEFGSAFCSFFSVRGNVVVVQLDGVFDGIRFSVLFLFFSPWECCCCSTRWRFRCSMKSFQLVFGGGQLYGQLQSQLLRTIVEFVSG